MFFTIPKDISTMKNFCFVKMHKMQHHVHHMIYQQLLHVYPVPNIWLFGHLVWLFLVSLATLLMRATQNLDDFCMQLLSMTYHQSRILRQVYVFQSYVWQAIHKCGYKSLFEVKSKFPLFVLSTNHNYMGLRNGNFQNTSGLSLPLPIQSKMEIPSEILL